MPIRLQLSGLTQCRKDSGPNRVSHSIHKKKLILKIDWRLCKQCHCYSWLNIIVHHIYLPSMYCVVNAGFHCVVGYNAGMNYCHVCACACVHAHVIILINMVSFHLFRHGMWLQGSVTSQKPFPLSATITSWWELCFSHLTHTMLY